MTSSTDRLSLGSAKARTAFHDRSPARRPRRFLHLFMRRKPTLYQRCLAVHIAGAGNNGALR